MLDKRVLLVSVSIQYDTLFCEIHSSVNKQLAKLLAIDWGRWYGYGCVDTCLCQHRWLNLALSVRVT